MCLARATAVGSLASSQMRQLKGQARDRWRFLWDSNSSGVPSGMPQNEQRNGLGYLARISRRRSSIFSKYSSLWTL